jgi:hypothetical protein
MTMLTVEYAEHGHAVSDFDYKRWLDNAKAIIASGKNAKLAVSTAMPIHALRLAIALGEIAPDAVTFEFWGQHIQANTFGALSEWPVGFADRDGAISADILRVATRKRRQQAGQPGLCGQ